jgi:hypothetical protein
MGNARAMKHRTAFEIKRPHYRSRRVYRNCRSNTPCPLACSSLLWLTLVGPKDDS